MFAPLRVSVPLPLFVRAPLPLTTPERVVSLEALVVRVKLPRVTLPAPAMVPTVSLAPRFRTAPLEMLTAPLSTIALLPLKVSVPALTVVVPV